jgi:uncharacterized membrane protein
MLRYLAAYAAVMVTMLALDIVWLGVIAKGLYQRGIGHLMAAQPNLAAALLFYIAYAAGLVYFVVAPRAITTAWSSTLFAGALFGAVAYATYDLSNLATLRDWPWHIAVVDICWGALASTLAGAAGKACLERIGA